MPKNEVLSIPLGPHSNLDLVWEGQECLVVISEHGSMNPVHKRTLVRLKPEQAMSAARFMARTKPLAEAQPLPGVALPGVMAEADCDPQDDKK